MQDGSFAFFPIALWSVISAVFVFSKHERNLNQNIDLNSCLASRSSRKNHTNIPINHTYLTFFIKHWGKHPQVSETRSFAEPTLKAYLPRFSRSVWKRVASELAGRICLRSIWMLQYSTRHRDRTCNTSEESNDTASHKPQSQLAHRLLHGEVAGKSNSFQACILTYRRCRSFEC